MKFFVVSVRLIVLSMRFPNCFNHCKNHQNCGGFVGTILMDLSKAYDCIPHELLIAKLNNTSLKLLLVYLTNRKQRTKIGSSFGSQHGPLLFKIFINDLFFSITKSEVCNLADDNTLYSSNKDLDHVFNNLYCDLNNVLDWFKLISIKAYPDKFQFMVLEANKNKSFSINVRGINSFMTEAVIIQKPVSI